MRDSNVEGVNRNGPVDVRPIPADSHAVDSLIHHRPRILRTKLAALATQIVERVRIRDSHQGTIEGLLLDCANGLLPFSDEVHFLKSSDFALRAFWLEQKAKLTTEARSQDVECWRDVAQLMTEFLSVWEAVEQSRVRAEFLSDQEREDRE